jgi:hypothetical protein
MTYLDETLAAALELSRAARWPRALTLLDAAAGDPARLALTAAEVALESDWFAETSLATARLATADSLAGPSWDLDFLHLRHDYLAQLRSSGTLEFGPAGKDPGTLAHLRTRAGALADQAPDRIRHGWARMYEGLILDNLLADRDAAPPHYVAALEAGEGAGSEAGEAAAPQASEAAPSESGEAAASVAGEAGDDRLVREALRHLGDHDRDRGDLATARSRWERATFLGARAGLVTGTLSQQMLLAVIARETGDEPGARRLATEIARWSAAIGASGLQKQVESFLAGAAVA